MRYVFTHHPRSYHANTCDPSLEQSTSANDDALRKGNTRVENYLKEKLIEYKYE